MHVPHQPPPPSVKHAIHLPPYPLNARPPPPQAIPTNTRFACNEVMEKAKAEKPWFGIEQVRGAAGLRAGSGGAAVFLLVVIFKFPNLR